jgi:hypothetical protein
MYGGCYSTILRQVHLHLTEVQGGGFFMAFNPSFSFANVSSSSLLLLVKKITQKHFKERVDVQVASTLHVMRIMESSPVMGSRQMRRCKG